MSDYGLTVYNANNGLMFDSRRKMNSYVVSEIGTGTGPSVTTNGPFSTSDADFVFIKIPDGQINAFNDQVIFYNQISKKFNKRQMTNTSSGGQWTTTFGPATEATLDYFTVKHSSKVSSSDDYGLVVFNADNTKQFDSRAIQLGHHFKINTYHEPRSVDAWSTTNDGVSLGSSSDYWEISNWTSGLAGTFEGDTDIVGIWFAGGPYAIGYYSVGNNTGPEGNTSATSDERWATSITGMILSAELT